MAKSSKRLQQPRLPRKLRLKLHPQVRQLQANSLSLNRLKPSRLHRPLRSHKQQQPLPLALPSKLLKPPPRHNRRSKVEIPVMEETLSKAELEDMVVSKEELLVATAEAQELSKEDLVLTAEALNKVGLSVVTAVEALFNKEEVLEDTE